MKTETIISISVLSFFLITSGSILISQYMDQNFQTECIKNGGYIQVQYSNKICVKR